MAAAIGKTRWVIAEGYIPGDSTGTGRAFESHETVCILNAGDADAEINIVVFFSDREPIGPFRLQVPARRTRHIRFNDLSDPQTIPRDTDYASLIESDQAIVCQHSRLDSRQAELALMTTTAYAVD